VDFTLSSEDLLLRDTARAYLSRELPIDRLAALADSEAGWDPGSWPRLVELGWLDRELDTVAQAVLADAAGYALYPGPWWSSVALAGEAYAAAGAVPPGPATLAWAEPGVVDLRDAATRAACRAERVAGGYRLTGVKEAVPDAGEVRVAVVVADAGDGPGLFALDLTEHPDAVAPMSTVDTIRRLARLPLSGQSAQLLVPPDKAAEVLHATWRRSLALLSAEAVGVAQRALDLAVVYARERSQFGRAIGGFQAVAHRLADVYTAVELARSLALRAAWCVEHDAGPVVDEAVLVATVASRAAALRATESAIQVFGGIGFTWEHPAHRWYRRALWIDGFQGHPGHHRARLAELLLDPNPA
jgi:alkylation response protein AidB-like acyl-CoA dehydrogenase